MAVKKYGKAYSALLMLLRSGLWERREPFEELFPLTEEEWSELFALATMQTVVGITYRGLDYLPHPFFPPEELLFRWVAEVGRIEERNYESNRTLVELLQIYRSHGLNPILQKGQGVATMYEQPLLRTCGDIDLCFLGEGEADKAAEIARSLGKSCHTAPDGSLVYRWESIEVEHHRELIDLQSPFTKGYIAGVVDGMEAEPVTLPEIPSEAVRVPSAEVNMLLLNAHIMKHAIGLGIGLRQICDMARAYYRLSGKVNGEKIRTLYNKAGLERWSSLLHAFLCQKMGLEEQYLPYKERGGVDAEPLAEIVFRGGNFGKHAKDHLPPTASIIHRKWHTFKAFCRNSRFSLGYVPGEAVCTIWQLLWGQLRA